MRRQRASGFTLIELLVLIGMCILLMALFLPGLLPQSRESPRKAQCSNNLKQIGIALQNYHAQWNAFPINYGSPTTGAGLNSKGRSWLLALLPYLEQQGLYDEVNFDEPLKHPDNRRVAQTVIQTFLCPSDDLGDGTRSDRDVPGTWAVTSYKSVAGSNWDEALLGRLSIYDFDKTTLYNTAAPKSRRPDQRALPQISYEWGRWSFEADGLEHGNGFICRNENWDAARNVTTHREMDKDGASNTLAVGEVVPDFCNKTWWYWYDGATATAAIPLNFKPGGRQPDPTDWGITYAFASRHSGGASFSMADGSVRWIRDSIDLTLYRNLACLRDGQVAITPN